ncbi:hypothetical protein GPJ56_008643 [Histomonas meleagridis]|uniref:uncharacterized protein n=1 Tax=Histomonas meleagridis TaxID=135588 RepID=UPI0035598A11|nr:hypothetical protein GPJ56_008643 [Histomonas meleagridis]KAH0805781.1 hypothetical protein GO595_001420 [Histomonas meleagridis]
MSEEAGPLAALLAQHPSQQETILDVHFKNSIAPKIEMQNHEKSQANKNLKQDKDDPIIVFDEGGDGDKPIGLTFRQPSFTSIDGNMVLKGGKPYSDARPTRTVPSEKTPKELTKQEEEEEDNDPQVQIVKELRTKNLQRWKEMGYEPPDDLIKLTRAHTQSSFRQIQLLNQKKPLKSFPYNTYDNGTARNNTRKNTRFSLNISHHHRRCGSDGMKLGEASSNISRMSEALMLKNRKPDPKAKIVYSDEESEEEPKELFGNLGKIVRHSDREIYNTVLTGDLSNVKDPKRAYKVFKKLRDKCISELWADEASYLTELIDGLDIESEAKRSANVNDIKQLQQKSRDSFLKYENRITASKEKENLLIEILNEQYEDQLLELEAESRCDNQNVKEKLRIKKILMREEHEIRIECIHEMCKIDVSDLRNHQKISQKKYSDKIKRAKRYKANMKPGVVYVPMKKDLLKVCAPKLLDRKNEKITDFDFK